MKHKLSFSLLLLSLLNPVFAQDETETPPATAQPSTPPMPATATQRQHLILVVGAPGTDEYQRTFMAWATRWQDAAKRANAGFTVVGLSTESTAPAEQLSAESDHQRLLDAIAAAGTEKTSEPLWIVFIGHGSFDGRTASWNLRGRDLSAEQLAVACDAIDRPLAIVACASCTSPFINAMSGPNRVIISATKDGSQIQYSRFGDAMSLAISTLEADINRDGQTSLLEAWLFASRRTAEFYKTEGRLATEHSLLDASGDAKGVRSELFEGDQVAASVKNPDEIDGQLAASWHLVRSEDERRLSPEQRKNRNDLESRIKALRKQKESLSEVEYLQQLKALLVPLAKLYESTNMNPQSEVK